MTSTKIQYKNKIIYVSTKDLKDNSINKLFAYTDPNLKTILKSYSGKTIMINKNDIEDKLKENTINLSDILLEIQLKK